jgi:hypothetical protein
MFVIAVIWILFRLSIYVLMHDLGSYSTPVINISHRKDLTTLDGHV